MADRRPKTKTRPDTKGTSGRPEAVRIRLLGGFEVSVGARTIEEDTWRLRKAASLVKLLALAPNHRLHREQAMEALWPDLGMRAASNNLRQTLHAARRTLDPAAGSRYLVSQGESLVICPRGSLWVDVEAFEEAAITARRSSGPAAYEAALDLYAGELLPADRYEEWAEEHRRRLRETHLSLLLGLARVCEELGEYDLAAEALRKVLVEEPTREEAHAGLMRLYALEGSKGEALAQYRRLEEALSRELGTEPAASSRALREEIAAARFPPKEASSLSFLPEKSPDTSQHNLPLPKTSFVGRERELVEVERALAMTRLLTLTGAGGSGKTRLALEVARKLVGTYLDGVWLVELAPLSEPELVLQEVARALGVREQTGRPLEDAIAETLREKGMLVVLDNCEHLVEAVASLADVLLAACPKVRVLATSREPLGVEGEALWPVTPLSVPGRLCSDLGELSHSESVRLFVERARQKVPSFALTLENAEAVAEVCRRLEGIPLAVELAAARMRALSAEQLAERLENSLELLSEGPRTAAPRQRTMRAALEWSYGLLSGKEKRLFGRLSVFAGGWTLEAAEAVCPGNGIEEGDVLSLVSSLTDKSLVVAATAGSGMVRYGMLEPIRQYARERLEESGEADMVRRRHAAFFLALAEEARPKFRGDQQRVWFELLETEHDNLRAVLSWALEEDETDLALRLGGALWEFWLVRVHWSEGRRWLEEALAKGGAIPASVRAEALYGAGRLADVQGEGQRALGLLEEASASYRESGDRVGVANCRTTFGYIALKEGDLERATDLLEESLREFRELGDLQGIGDTLGGLAALAADRNDLERALALYEETLALDRQTGDIAATAFVLSNMGWFLLARGEQQRAAELFEESVVRFQEAGLPMDAVALAHLGVAVLVRGDREQATKLLKEGLASSRELGYRLGIAYGLEGMSMLAGIQAKAERAARLWGAAEALHEAMGRPLAPASHMVYEPYLAAVRARLGEEAWEAAFAEGRAMTLEESVEYALSEEELTPPAASAAPEESSVGTQPVALTRREEEVAILVARGLTNRQIASELVISERTVHHHVTSILKKLGLRSRRQLGARLSKQHPQRPSTG